MKKALILVDIQNDFLPGGSLAVQDGDKIFPVINQLLEKPFDLKIATQDWHPADHGSFAHIHHKKPGEHVILNGLDQTLWPAHCIQGTPGAAFHSGWNFGKIQHVFHKGIDKNIDSYSTFFDNGHLRSTGLEKFLKDHGVQDIYLAGLATDYCVKFSALDAAKLGFNVYVLRDGCRAINLREGDEGHAFEEMEKAGVKVISLKELKI